MLHYEIEMHGPVTEEMLADLMVGDDLAAVTVEPAGSVLTTGPTDQAALIGLLERLQDLGLTVQGLQAVPGER